LISLYHENVNVLLRDPNSASSTIIWPQYESYEQNSTNCRQLLNVHVVESNTESNEVVSRSWEFWNKYYDLLGKIWGRTLRSRFLLALQLQEIGDNNHAFGMFKYHITTQSGKEYA